MLRTAVARRNGPAAAAPRKLPFRYGTRQRFAPILPRQTYADLARVSVPLPRVGFLAGIVCRLSGTMNLGAGTTLTTRGPWDLIRELVVRVNIGASTIYRTTGYGNYMVQRLLTHAFDPQGALGTPTADADLFAAGVAMGNNTWALTYYIPIAENFGRQSHLGLINLQAPEIEVTLDVQFGQETDAVAALGGGTGFAGNLDMGYWFYEVPNPQKAFWPPLVFYRTIESDQGIAATGDQIFTAPREGVLHRIAHLVQINDARDNGVDNLRIRFNRTDEVYRYDRWQLKWLQFYNYGAQLPVGMFVHDWWAAEGLPGEGDNRDMISSESLSTLESIVNTTTAIAGTLNRLNTIRELTQIVAL